MPNFSPLFDAIIKNRKTYLAKLDMEIDKTSKLKTNVSNLLDSLGRINEDSPLVSVNDAVETLRAKLSDLEARITRLTEARKLFLRETVNVGVSGQARVGKSTLLQKISGLGDDQIPAGAEGVPMTAVHSRIYCSAEGESGFAIVRLRDKSSFLNDYIYPHWKCVSTLGAKPATLESFISFNLPPEISEEKEKKPLGAVHCLRSLRLCSHEIDKSVEICYTIKKTEVFFDGRAFGGVSSA
ncbi:MAG: hypothetical protein LBJ11_03460 [Oscillospiraceae bacterium]|jgi:hypothetical protein|nr:hypothetical protein [Oscillospiraceae bacterium]